MFPWLRTTPDNYLLVLKKCLRGVFPSKSWNQSKQRLFFLSLETLEQCRMKFGKHFQEGFSRHQSEEDSEDSSTKSRRGSVTNGPFSTIECVSSRTLKLNFHPCRGLHYHLPVLFDYFHMAAVTTTIHMVLLSIHQPYITWV